MEQKGIEIINTLVRKWTDKYLFLTKYLGAVGVDTYKYQCEFSLPCPTKPVPAGTVKVYFLLKEKGNDYQISFRFENDQLVHHVDQTIVGAKMEQWLERYLNQKSQTAKILFLGTEFEETRIKHPHLDKIAADLAWRPEIKDPRYLSEDLLEHSQELMVKEELQEQQQEQITRMRKVMFDMFRSIDKDDLGVVSHAEFVQVLDNMQLTLSQSEKKFLINIADLDARGIVDYYQFVKVGCEFIFGWFLKNEVDIMTEIKEEEFLIEAVMVVYNDALMQKMQEVSEKCKEKDEDETGEVHLNLLEEILFQKLGTKDDKENEQENAIEEWKQQQEEKLEERKKQAQENIQKKQEKERREREKNNEPPRKPRKLSRQQQKLISKRQKQLKNWQSSKMQEILEQERGLAEEELEGFVKFVKRSYPETVPYNQLGIFYLSYKVNDIKNGLMDSSLNKMDKYLITLFKRFEGKKKNRINLQQMVDALRQADKFCLSQFQLFMIQSFVEKDDEMMVDYTVEARFVGEVIKKLFTPVLNVKKVKFLEKAMVNHTEFMNGWTEEQLKNQMEELFVQYDSNKDNVLDLQEYKNCVKGCRIRMNDQKIEEMMRMADTNKDGVIDKQEFFAHFYDVLKVYKCKLALERIVVEKKTI